MQMSKQDQFHENTFVGSAPDAGQPRQGFKSRDQYPPYIPFCTTMSTNAARMLELVGRAMGLFIGADAWDEQSQDREMRTHVLPDIKQSLQAMTEAMAEYERRTFRAPSVTAEEYQAMTEREKLRAMP